MKEAGNDEEEESLDQDPNEDDEVDLECLQNEEGSSLKGVEATEEENDPNESSEHVDGKTQGLEEQLKFITKELRKGRVFLTHASFKT